MVFKDGDDEYELVLIIPDLKEVAQTSLINLLARSEQIEKIASRDRMATVEYKQAVVGNYLESYRLFSKQYANWKELYDGGNWQGGLVKEIMDFLVFVKKYIHGKLKKVGLEHREVNRETHEYALDGF